MGLFAKLFGKPEPIVMTEDNRIGVALLAILKPQIALLGFELGEVPAEGDFVSDTCRGYLFGLSGGILVCEGIDRGPDGPVFRALVAAFELVYGSGHATRLAVRTVQDTADEEGDAFAASEWAIREVQEIFRSGGATQGSGFYLAATGRI